MKNMVNYVTEGEEVEKKAEKRLSGWSLFSNKYEDAADLFDKAANFYKLAKSWDQAGSAYLKLASCQLKLDSKYEAANAYTEAGHAYKKTSPKEATSCLEQSVNCFLEIGRLSMAARYRKEIAEMHENNRNLEQAIIWYEKAADLFQSEELSNSANRCRQKIAQYSAELEQYPKAIEIYEDIARHSLSSRKYEVKGHLLNAGLCHLCKGDTVSITNALDRYQDMDPTFTGARECKLLSDLASAVDERDTGKFTAILKEFEFDSMTRLDPWKTTLLLRVKAKLIEDIEDDDDLT